MTNQKTTPQAAHCPTWGRCSATYWHAPLDLQTCEWQSLLLPHEVPVPQFGAQACATQTAFRQIFDPQFPASLHAVPLPQVGEQAGA
jgi:hypothetical protein